MNDDKPDADVLVFRNPITERPVAVPEQVVLEAERPYRAYLAHLGGTSWPLIAVDEGYADVQAAQRDVQRYLQEGRAVVADYRRREMLAMEIARLDALQTAIWANAMGGHLPSVTACMNLIITRVRLLALDQGEADTGDDELDAKTVVIPADRGYGPALAKMVTDGG